MQDNQYGEFAPKSASQVLAMAVAIGAATGVEPPQPETPDGKYDEVYNASAHSRRMNKARKAAKKMPGLFRVGEVVEVKGSSFRICAFGRRTMTLQLLPKFKEDEGEKA